jgi:hypothetical protein
MSGCEFIGSLGDQVFICRHCAAYPDECADGDCCCNPDREAGDA